MDAFRPEEVDAVVPRASHAIERFSLANGLRVILNRDGAAPVVSVAVVYGAGIRCEPPGRTGFAHLFEHLMFQGSANLERLAHFRLVQGAGGMFNGSTRLDYTEYYQTVPSNACDRALFLEADRMRAPRLTGDELRRQVKVVQEEIKGSVLNRPYGGFPVRALTPLLFDTYANAHDGYGSFGDLEAATVDDTVDFFRRFYVPGNAVLCVAGDVDADAVRAAVERYFGDVPPGRGGRPDPPPAEPDLTAARHVSYVDRLAPAPSVAAAWRVPDPVADLASFIGYVVLAAVLTTGVASRLVRRLVAKEQVASSVAGYVGFMGDPFDVLDPTAIVLHAHLHQGADRLRTLDMVDEEIARLAADGPEPGELARARTHVAAKVLRAGAAPHARAVRMAVYELLRGRPELVNELPGLIGAVSEEAMREAAARLRPDRRASVEAVAGGVPPAAAPGTRP
jgi:predicted Zn-dependent peptidase